MCERKINHWIYPIMVLTVCFIFILSTSWYMKTISTATETYTTGRFKELTQFTEKAQTKIDSITQGKKISVTPKEIQALNARNEVLAEYMTNVINDYRQECNNYINKVNGWLTFAIGLVTIIGGIIPAALQIKLSFDFEKEKDKIDDKLEKAQTELSTFKNNLTSEQNSLKQEIERKLTFLDTKFNEFCNQIAQTSNDIHTQINDLHKDCLSIVNKEIENYKTQINTSLNQVITTCNENTNKLNECLKEANNTINDSIRKNENFKVKLESLYQLRTICQSLEDNLIDNSSERNSIYETLWKGSLEAFAKLIKLKLETPNLDEQDKHDIIQSLVYLNSFLTTLKIRAGNVRELNKYSQKVSDILNSLQQVSPRNVDSELKKLDDLQRDLDKLSLSNYIK